jgi:ABC-type Fe3+-hydroxamate transport system substrate-binding protein
LRPDLLIVPSWYVNERGQLLAPLQAAGVPVVAVDYNSQDPERHVSSTLAIGAAIGMEERARRLATLYRDKITEITALAAKAGRRPKVYIEIGMNGPDVFGNTYRNTMWGRMIDLIGAENIANSAIPSGFAPMAAEQVLAARPDFIFITGSSWANQPRAVRLGYDVDLAAARASLAQYLSRAGWSELPAVKSGNVFTIEHTLTRSLMDWISLQYIAKQLYPEFFANTDPEQALRDYHAEFLPVAYSGTWMARLSS